MNEGKDNERVGYDARDKRVPTQRNIDDDEDIISISRQPSAHHSTAQPSSHPIIRHHCSDGPEGSQTATNPLGALGT